VGIGVEGDWDWTNLSGTTFNTSCAFVGCTTQSNWLATVRGRAGWAWNRVLFYGTAGAAFANVQAAAGAFPFMNSTEAGWTAGVGLEYAFAPNWTAKAEYLFVDLANASCGFANCGGTHTAVSLNENIVRAGVNFKFGAGGGSGPIRCFIAIRHPRRPGPAPRLRRAFSEPVFEVSGLCKRRFGPDLMT
jgi:outer membrane immunogenic protein